MFSKLAKLEQQVPKGPWYPRATNDDMWMNARFVSTKPGIYDTDERWLNDSKQGLSVMSDEQENPRDVIAITLLQHPFLVINKDCDEITEFIAEARNVLPDMLEYINKTQEFIEQARKIDNAELQGLLKNYDL
jgi:hypothetical protein